MPRPTERPSARRPLRLWPGVTLLIVQLLAWIGLRFVFPGFEGFKWAAMSAFAGTAAIVLWWLLASRARWYDRLGALALIAIGLWGTWQLRHPSMGPHWLTSALPILSLLFVGALVLTRGQEEARRRTRVAGALVLACFGWLLVRTEGIDGDHLPDYRWRFTASSEERLLAGTNDRSAATDAATPPLASVAAWPGFRGPRRDGVVHGVRIATDWSTSPPIELWRQPVGPGWSSFAVQGHRVYTQEQRGEQEIVACYDARSGDLIWQHADPVRFFESNAGAGPRATPTLHQGRVYAYGATGILNALDAADGTLVWSRDTVQDTGASVPTWGFSSSPLVTADLVVVDAGALIAYDLATGARRWTGEPAPTGYSSPHLLELDGVAQVLLPRSGGLTSVAPADGTVLWEHEWDGFGIVQPAVTPDGDVLISAGAGIGTQRLTVTRSPEGWTAATRWSSIRLKAYFNDFVVHEGLIYGFDDRILAAIDLETGERAWKGGRYGNGQLVLLADQDLLLVLTEDGDLTLVSATADTFQEHARMPALEGKTWNHPVVVDDLLLVRNSQEMAAYRLPGVVRAASRP